MPAPALTPLYFKKAEASEVLWRGGYLHIQDIAVTHPDGSVQIVDRLKDVIKTGGEWISSIEVEGPITQVPWVHEVAVIGVPDEKWGERPMRLWLPLIRSTRVPNENIFCFRCVPRD